MNSQRRKLIIATYVAAIFMACGCTKFLDAAFEGASHSTYQENTSSILITEDGKQLVVLGHKYHYVFTSPPKLLDVLRSPIQNHVVAKIPPLLAEENGKMTGVLYLVMDENAPPDIRENASSYGFHPNGWRGMFSYEARLEGMRYVGKETISPLPTINLRHTYSITIENLTSRNGEKNPIQIALSPVTQTIDGVLMLGGIPLFALFGLFLSR